MKLVAAKCPSCGANIDVDANSDSTKCEFCNTKILVDDAIQKLRVEISGKVEINNLPKLENYLKNADRYYSNNVWNEAWNQYSKALELDPDNYQIVLRNGLCGAVCSNDYNSVDVAIKESMKYIDNNNSTVKNQIASESANALYVISNNILTQYKNQMFELTETINRFNQISVIANLYLTIINLTDDIQIKKPIMKTLIWFIDELLKKKRFISTLSVTKNVYFSADVDSPNVYNSLLNIRNNTANTYNLYANDSEKIKVKRGPIPKFLVYLIVAFVIVLLIILFAVLSTK